MSTPCSDSLKQSMRLCLARQNLNHTGDPDSRARKLKPIKRETTMACSDSAASCRWWIASRLTGARTPDGRATSSGLSTCAQPTWTTLGTQTSGPTSSRPSTPPSPRRTASCSCPQGEVRTAPKPPHHLLAGRPCSLLHDVLSGSMMSAKALQLLAERLWHHSHWPALCELMTDDRVHVQGRACATSCRRYCSRASPLSYLPWCPSSRIRCAVCSAVRNSSMRTL